MNEPHNADPTRRRVLRVIGASAGVAGAVTLPAAARVDPGGEIQRLSCTVEDGSTTFQISLRNAKLGSGHTYRACAYHSNAKVADCEDVLGQRAVGCTDFDKRTETITVDRELQGRFCVYLMFDHSSPQIPCEITDSECVTCSPGKQ